MFLSSRRLFGICGNEFDNEDKFSFFTRIQEIKNVLENPYVYVFNSWKENNDSLYTINEKTVVFGYIESDHFYSKEKRINLKIDSLKSKNKVYEINFASIKKDTAMVDVMDSYDYYSTEKY